MAYEKQEWKNLPDQTTPITAERLSHLETQYDEAIAAIPPAPEPRTAIDRGSLPFPGGVYQLDNEWHPGGQGSNVFQLITVPTKWGPQLVGCAAKGSGIINFTTGKTIHNFADLGPGPMLAPDSYVTQALWRKNDASPLRLYLGGWVKRPAIVGAANNHTNKYSWVGEFDAETLQFIRYIVLDKAKTADSWQSEVSDLIPTPNGLAILRGDAQEGSATGDRNHGTWFYNGDDFTDPAQWQTVETDPSVPNILVKANVARLSQEYAVKGGIYNDRLIVAKNYAKDVLVFNLINNPPTPDPTFTYTSVQARAIGAVKSVDNVWRSRFAKLSSMLWHGTTNGYFLGDPRITGDCIFMPCLISPNGGGIVRAWGYRSQVVQVAGGIVVGVNTDIGGLRTDAAQAMLIYIGMNGTVRILDVGGAYGGLAVYGEHLVYGTANLGHNDTYTNLKENDVAQQSMLVSEINTRRPPAFTERISFTSYSTTTSGENGYFGGYPTLGYKKGSIWLQSTLAGNLTITNWTVAKGGATGNVRRESAPIAFAAGESKWIDLSTIPGALGGDILGFKFSAGSGSLIGSVSLEP